MQNHENQSSIFGVNVSQISTSQGGISQLQQITQIGSTGAVINDSAFNQMMQLMFGFCRNSNCSEATVRLFTSEGNFETLSTVFTTMCPNYNL